LEPLRNQKVDRRSRRARRRARRGSALPSYALAAGLAVLALVGVGLGWLLGARLSAAPGARPAVSAAPPVTPAPAAPAVLLGSPPSDEGALEVALGRSDEGPQGLGVAPGGVLLRERIATTPESGWPGPLRVDYAISAELSRETLRVLRRGRVQRGHVIVMDPWSGRVLAYVSTDPEAFPAQGVYPAASLVKIITATALLARDPGAVDGTCVYRGNPYRLRRSHLRPVRSGNRMSLERSLASSNNQCFAKLAVHEVGQERLMHWIDRFGWYASPAPGHGAGTRPEVDDDYDLGRLGSGLMASRITPLHAVQLAASLAHGKLVQPWWVDRVVDGLGRELALPDPAPPTRVMSRETARTLREMLVRTTERGTARSAFRDRRGRAKLRGLRVAGKTGNLSGRDGEGHWEGRYEWFAGVAPADDPQVAIAVVQQHGHLWWMKSSEIAADVLRAVFCERRHCAPELARRYTGTLGDAVAPVFLRESEADDEPRE